MEGLNIVKEKTALVLIDLQKGIVGRETKPYSASTVVGNATRLVKAFRKDGMPVFLLSIAVMWSSR